MEDAIVANYLFALTGRMTTIEFYTLQTNAEGGGTGRTGETGRTGVEAHVLFLAPMVRSVRRQHNMSGGRTG